ncbi:MAG: helix-turn-helix domain-containing protein [Myxococcota bacterium]
MSRLPTDDRYAQLLQGARELFAGHAFDALSTAEIARRLGVSKALLFHYFKTKRGLYVASVRAAVAELIAMTEPDPSEPPAVQLWQSMSVYLDWVRANQGEQQQLLQGGIGVDEEVLAIIEEPRAITLQRVLRALGLTESTLELELAVSGWLGFSEEVARYWAPRTSVPKELALGQIVASLQTALAVAKIDASVLKDPQKSDLRRDSET